MLASQVRIGALSRHSSTARLFLPSTLIRPGPRSRVSMTTSASSNAGVRHCVLLKLKDNSPEKLNQIKANLDALPEAIPGIKAYQTGADAKLMEGNADFAITADFASEEEFKEYASHPAHVKVINELIKPILESRSAVQFRL